MPGRFKKKMGKANLALKLAKKALRQNKPELKLMTRSLTQTPDDSTGALTILTNIIQGDRMRDRDGRNIQIKSIQVEGLVVASLTVPETLVRIMVCKMIDVDEQIPTINEVLDTVDIISLRNLNRQPNFKVLADRRFNLSSGTREKTFFKIRKSFKNLKQQYVINESGASFQEMERNALFILSISDQAVIDAPLITFEARTRFTDV